MRVVVLITFLVCALASTEIVVIENSVYSPGFDDVSLVSKDPAYTNQLAPGEDAIFWFTLPQLADYPVGKHAQLNLYGHQVPLDLGFNVRLRKGNDNFDDRDTELKKKTWGQDYDSSLYTCEVETDVKYYIQVENPSTNTNSSSLSISLDVDNDDTCKAVDSLEDALGIFFGGIFLAILICICGIAGVIAVICLCIICLCRSSNRNAQASVQVLPGQAQAPHPYYNPHPAPNRSQQQAHNAEAQIPYYAQPASQNSSQEAANSPLMPTYAQAPPRSEAV